MSSALEPLGTMASKVAGSTIESRGVLSAVVLLAFSSTYSMVLGGETIVSGMLFDASLNIMEAIDSMLLNMLLSCVSLTCCITSCGLWLL